MPHTHGDPRATRRARLRAAQLAYLTDVEDRTQLTPSEIAKLLQRDPSTLTRFRNKADYNGTLSPQIIAQIEAATGIAAPPEAKSKLAAAGTVPVTEPIVSGLHEPDAEPYIAPIGDPMAALVTAAVAGRAHVVPWRLNSRILEDEGYKPGDILIVDLNAQPQPGDVVCVQLYDWERPGATRTTFRLYHPPFIVGASREEGGRVPKLIDGSVGIKGVVGPVIRPPRR